jgi:hypothetical protein
MGVRTEHEDGTEDGKDGENQSDAVGPASTALAVADRREEDRPPRSACSLGYRRGVGDAGCRGRHSALLVMPNGGGVNCRARVAPRLLRGSTRTLGFSTAARYFSGVRLLADCPDHVDKE